MLLEKIKVEAVVGMDEMVKLMMISLIAEGRIEMIRTHGWLA